MRTQDPLGEQPIVKIESKGTGDGIAGKGHMPSLEPFSFILNQWKGSMVLFLPQNAWLKGLPF